MRRANVDPGVHRTASSEGLPLIVRLWRQSFNLRWTQQGTTHGYGVEDDEPWASIAFRISDGSSSS